MREEWTINDSGDSLLRKQFSETDGSDCLTCYCSNTIAGSQIEMYRMNWCKADGTYDCSKGESDALSRCQRDWSRYSGQLNGDWGSDLRQARVGRRRHCHPSKSLIAVKCLSCHHGDDAKGKFDLTTRETMVSGGDTGPGIDVKSLEKSQLWQRVAQDEMPPKHPLSADEKKILNEWISAGAPWIGGALDPQEVTSEHRAGLDWWSLQPLKSVPIPNTKLPGVRRQPLDDFVLEKLAGQGLSMSPEAERRTLIRRISFDLLGLPPSPEDIEQFIQDDHPDACERFVDRCLASPHYGERWARHWLDVVRFGESNGFERDLPRPNAWHYRDWVIGAFNHDMPYDDFVRWQLAGDLMAPGDLEAIKAVGFLVAGAHDTVVPVVDKMRAMMRQDELEDIVGTISQTFLGLTANCARCHDHKFDPITTREYYQIAAALSGIDHGDRELISPEVAFQLAKWQARINQLTKQLYEQQSPIRDLILADRATSGASRVGAGQVPVPMAAWDFRRDLSDLIGDMHVTVVGAAKQTSDGLLFDGNSFARTSRLPRDLFEKTLEVRVQLTTLQQAGGGAISVQTVDGQTFDAIVYAEAEPGRWMPGSNGFQRTFSYQGAVEDRADKEVVVMTQVHRADGTIVAYRNGQPYGSPVRKDAAIKFAADRSQVIFGLRHGTDVGGNRMLRGTIVAARMFDKALSPEEVAVSVDVNNTFVTEAEIISRLSPDDRRMRLSLQSELTGLKQKYSDLTKRGPINVYTAIATQPAPMKIHKRGSVASLGDVVAPAGLAAIQGLSPDFGLRPDAIESHRRRSLANWITDDRNPLFARVMANRVWHYHFGAGLVESPNDLGFNAGMPSHPELLDWLAAEFVGRDRNLAVDGARQRSISSFSLKRMHRLIISSATYRQSSTFNPKAAERDASNRLLWRISPRRLEAEAVRDAMLVVAGELNSQIGGKGYADVNSYFFKGTQFYDPIDPIGYTNQRRTIYRMWARGGRNPFLDTFDCPDPSSTTPRRSATVTPLQALSLLNNSFSLRMADNFARRLTSEAGQSADAQISLGYRLLFGREPNADELTLSRDFVARRGLAEFCRAMWNSSEFLFID